MIHERPMNPESRKGSAMMMGIMKMVNSTISRANGKLYGFDMISAPLLMGLRRGFPIVLYKAGAPARVRPGNLAADNRQNRQITQHGQKIENSCNNQLSLDCTCK